MGSWSGSGTNSGGVFLVGLDVGCGGKRGLELGLGLGAGGHDLRGVVERGFGRRFGDAGIGGLDFGL